MHVHVYEMHALFCIAVSFQKVESSASNFCYLLDPVEGRLVRSNLECSGLCAERKPECHGFMYLDRLKLCKLVGLNSSGFEVSPFEDKLYMYTLI